MNAYSQKFDFIDLDGFFSEAEKNELATMWEYSIKKSDFLIVC